MSTIVTNYLIYAALSVALTVWVARTLFRGGRAFLVDVFGDNEALAESVNRLLVVGFYLVNLGFVSLYLRQPKPVTSAQTAVEALSAKMGVVLLVLGAMHFGNLVVFSRWRRHVLAQGYAPVDADGIVTQAPACAPAVP